MSKSLKVNFIYNLLNSLSSLLFPLIAFPYATRIMLADGIGLISFFQSIIQYITLLTSLGIPLYAIRKVAKIRDDVDKLSRATTEIFILNIILVAGGYLLVLIFAQTVAEVQVNLFLFLILSLTILFTAIGCEWFYQGIEEFKYITIRGLIVKILSLVILFLFVKTEEDIMWYAGYTVFGPLGGNLFNFFRLRKYINFRKISFKTLHPFRHLKPALHIFILNLVISIYVYLNTVMLGFLSDTASVGFYTAANKLSHVLLTLVSALGTVMLVRLSNLVESNQQERFAGLSHKALTFVLAITIPLSVGMFLTAPYLIELFCGPEFVQATLALKILSPIILVVGLSNALGIQILYPQGQENKVILCIAIGAIVNFCLNLWLIPKYSYEGAAIATLVAEIIVTGSMMIIGRKYIRFNWGSKTVLNYIFASILMSIGVVVVINPNSFAIVNLLNAVAVGGIIYIIWLLIVRDKTIIELLSIMKRRR